MRIPEQVIRQVKYTHVLLKAQWPAEMIQREFSSVPVQAAQESSSHSFSFTIHGHSPLVLCLFQSGKSLAKLIS